MNAKAMLMQGDCMEQMDSIPDGSVDMVLCDLPYGVTGCEWDTPVPVDKLWLQYRRVCKKGSAIVLTSAQPFTTMLIYSNINEFKYCWVWDKHIPRGFQSAKFKPMSKHEDVCVFCVGGGRLRVYNPQMVERDKPVKVKNYSKNGFGSNVSIKGSDKEYVYTHKGPDSIITGCWEPNAGKVHPTQKPVSLCEYLIRTYTNKGDTVLDNTMGSGTTGVACLNTERVFIGIEKDARYFGLAKSRIESCPA